MDLGGEAEQPSVSVGPVGLGGRFGEAVLLGSAVQHVQRSVLDVNRLLHQGGVQHQVGGRWANIQKLPVSLSLRLEAFPSLLHPSHSLSEQMTPAANLAALF